MLSPTNPIVGSVSIYFPFAKFRFPESSPLPHDIRLAGPWEYSAGTATDWQRCKLPWTTPDKAASFTIRRKFHRPTGIDEKSVLSLIVIAPSTIDSIDLNAASVTCANASPHSSSNDASDVALLENEFVVTTLLKEFNTVEISIGESVAAVHQVILRISDG